MIAADAGIRTLLTADGTLVGLASNGIHNISPPEGTVPPYGIYHSQNGTPHRTMRTPVHKLDCLYLLQGVGVGTASKGPAQVAEEIRDRMRVLITGQTGDAFNLSVTGYRVKDARWLYDFQTRYQTIGGVRRAYADAYVMIWLSPSA